VHLAREATPEQIASRLDGLVLAGGEDIDPGIYGGVAAEASVLPDRERDDYELELLAAACARGLPVLGVCRGAQLINVAAGGTLIGHLAGPSAQMHTSLDVPHGRHRHLVATAAGSLIRRLKGEQASVNSLHHQAVDRPGAGLRITAVAPDGTPEAIESEDGNILGVQWHPELHEHDSAVTWLVSRAAAATDADYITA
jgi:putative glutamine amidotransferase